MSRRAGFTLIEVLLASTLAAILMGGVLAVSSALSRDRRQIEMRESRAHGDQSLEILRRDLANALAFIGQPNSTGFEIVGSAGIDPRTFAGNHRLARITWRIMAPTRDRGGVLVRQQVYLDDPIRPDRATEILAIGVKRIDLTLISGDAEPIRLSEYLSDRLHMLDKTAEGFIRGTRVPSRVRARIEYVDAAIDKDLVLR